MADGVATRPIKDLVAYVEELEQFVYKSGAFMKPLFAAAKSRVREGGRARIVYTEGEDERVLRAVQVVVDEKIARPILVGRPAVLAARIEQYGLRLRLGGRAVAGGRNLVVVREPGLGTGGNGRVRGGADPGGAAVVALSRRFAAPGLKT